MVHARMALIAIILSATSLSKAAEAIVRTGIEDPRLASFDRLMTSFLAERKVPGAAIAVARNGRLVYSRGFGYADVQQKVPVQPNSLFRIASVSKPFTSAAVMLLVQQGKLRLDDHWYPVLRMSPLPGEHLDEGLKQITIRELLQHRGGWDRNKSFDPMFRPVLIARKLGTAPPAGPRQVIQYMLGQPLDFAPGERYAYSNFGYCILGRVIEQVSHEPYDQFVRQHVLLPLGIRDMRLGRSLPQFRAAGEVKYYSHGTGESVFASNLGRPVPWCYGGWNLEAMDSHGGWIASAVDLVRFGCSFDQGAQPAIVLPDSIRQLFARPPGEAGFEPDGKPKVVYYGCGWSVRIVGPGRINTWHNGLFDGTSSLLVRRWDGLTWAVIFNTDRDAKEKVLSDLIDPLLHGAADEVKQWPQKDLFGQYLQPSRGD